jgi:hypothetical protein
MGFEPALERILSKPCLSTPTSGNIEPSPATSPKSKKARPCKDLAKNRWISLNFLVGATGFVPIRGEPDGETRYA